MNLMNENFDVGSVHFWLRQEPKVSRCRPCVCDIPQIMSSSSILKSPKQANKHASMQASRQVSRQVNRQASMGAGKQAGKQEAGEKASKTSEQVSRQGSSRAQKHLEGIQSEPCPGGACYI